VSIREIRGEFQRFIRQLRKSYEKSTDATVTLSFDLTRRVPPYERSEAESGRGFNGQPERLRPAYVSELPIRKRRII